MVVGELRANFTGEKGETVVGWSKRRREVSLVGSLREHNGRDFTQGQVGTA